MWKFQFCSSSSSSSSSPSLTCITQKLYGVCTYTCIIHTKRLLCYQVQYLPFLVLDSVQDTTSKLQPQNCIQRCITFLFVDFWASLHLLRMWKVHSQATPGSLNVCVTICDEFASNQLRVSNSSTIVFSIYLAMKTNLSGTENAVVHLATFWISAAWKGLFLEVSST